MVVDERRGENGSENGKSASVDRRALDPDSVGV